MNKEYLLGAYNSFGGQDKLGVSFDDWVLKIQDNDDYKQGMFNHFGGEEKLGSDYNNWNSKVFALETPTEDTQEETTSNQYTSNIEHAQNSRKGVRQNKDGTVSSHLMASGESDGKYYAYPTLFQNEDETWYEPEDAFNEAKNKNELYQFDTEQESIDFAEGSWKPEESLNGTEENNQEQPSKLSDFGTAVYQGAVEFGSGLAGLPNLIGKTIASSVLPSEDLETLNKLPEEAREQMLSNMFGGSSSTFGQQFTGSTELQNKLTDKADELSSKMIQYEGNIVDDIGNGNYSDALYRTVRSIGQSAPALVAAMTPLGLSGMAVSVASQKQEHQEREGRDLGWKTIANSGINGVAEAAFEKFTLNMLKPFKGLAKGNKELASRYAKDIFKTVSKDFAIESSSEAATEIVQEISDKLFSGEDIDWKQLAKNSADAALIGGAMGGSIGTGKSLSGHVMYRTSSELERNEIDKTITKVDELESLRTKDNTKTIDKSIELTRKQLNDFKEGTLKQWEGLELEDKKNVIEISKEVDQIKNTITNNEISPELKSDLQAQAKGLEAEKKSILEKSKTFKKLSPEEKLPYVEKAGKELEKENAGKKEYEITEKETNQKAEDIFEQELLKSLDEKQNVPEKTTNDKVGEVLPEQSKEVKEKVETITDAIDTPKEYTYEGEKGNITKDGQQIVFESGDKIIELGNIDEIKDKTLDELNVQEVKTVEVTINDDNSIDVEGKKYMNNYSNPTAAITKTKDGYSVTLETEDGKKRTFRGNQAENIAYQYKLKEFDKDGTEEKYESGLKEIEVEEGTIQKEVGKTTVKEPISSTGKSKRTTKGKQKQRTLKTIKEPISKKEVENEAAPKKDIAPDGNIRPNITKDSDKGKGKDIQSPVNNKPNKAKNEVVKPVKKGIFAKGVTSLKNIMKSVFGLNKEQSDANSVIGDIIIDNFAKRLGITKAEAYKQIAFKKGDKADEKRLTGDSKLQGVHGAMVIEDGKDVIYALTNPNVSTPLHELAHVYEKALNDKERKTILTWAGHTTWTTDTSEKFARGFEQYLRTGKAPIKKLQSIFDKFKKWLTEIYNSTSDLDGIVLNDAMTEVYEKMLGVDVRKDNAKIVKYNKSEFRVYKDADGNTVILKKDGSEIKEKIKRKLKNGKFTTSANPIFRKIESIAYGYKLDAESKAERKKKLDKALNDFNPSTPEDFALVFFASGGTVSLNDAIKQTGFSQNELKWVTGFKKESDLTTIAKAGEKIADDNKDLPYNDTDYIAKLLDVLADYKNRTDVQDALIDLNESNDKKDPQQNISDEEVAFLEEQERKLQEITEEELRQLEKNQKDYENHEERRINKENNDKIEKEPEVQEDDRQSPELKEINQKIEKGKETLSKAKLALKNKGKLLDKNIVKDQEDLFGERKSDNENKLFDERVDLNVRNDATSKERKAVENAEIELKKLQEAKQDLIDGDGGTPALFQASTPKKLYLDFGIPIASAKTVITAMKRGVRTSKTSEELIEKGLVALRKTKWYKGLNKADQTNAESELTKWVAKPADDVIQSIKSQEKKKSDIRATKLKETSAKLRKKYKDEKIYKRELIKAVREKLDAEDMNYMGKQQFTSLLSKLNNATVKTMPKLLQAIETEILIIKNKRAESILKKLEYNPKNFITKNQSGKSKAKTIDNETRKRVEYISKWSSQHSDDIQNEINRLENIGETTNIYDLYVAQFIAQAAESKLKAKSYKKSDIEHVRLMKIALHKNTLAINELIDLINEGKSTLKQQVQAEAERLKIITTEGSESTAHKYTGKTKSELQKINFDKKHQLFKKMFGTSMERINKFFVKQTTNSFEFLLGYVDQINNHGKGQIYKRFYSGEEGLVQRDNNFVEDKRNIQKELNENISKIIGKKYKNIFADYFHAKEINKQKKTGIKLLDKEGERNKTGEILSLNQALYVHLVSKMEAQRNQLMNEGWDDVAMEQLENFIGDKYVEVSDYITNMLEQKYEKYNSVHLELLRTDLGFEKGYFPTKYEDLDMQAVVNLGGETFTMAGVMPGNIIEKVKNNNRIDTTQNAFDVMFQYFDSMERFYHYGRFIKDMNALLTNKGFKNNVQSYDKQSYSDLVNVTKAVIGDKSAFDVRAVERGLYGLNAAVASGYILWKGYTALKQFLSMPAYSEFADMFEVGGKKIPLFHKTYFGLKMLGQMNPISIVKNFKFLRKNSVSFDERMNRGNVGDEFIASLLSPGKSKSLFKSLFSWFIKKGIAPNKLIDAITISTGGKVLYNQQNRKYIRNGLTKSEAHKQAIRDFEVSFKLTQQSSDLGNLGEVQIRKGALTSLFVPFKNAQFSYFRRLMANKNNILKRYNRSKLSYIKSGSTETQAGVKAFNTVVKKADTWNELSNILMYSHVLPLIWQYVASGLPGLLTEWDDEDDEELKRAAFLGPIDGLFIMNDISKFAYNTMVLKKNWELEQSILLSEIQKLFHDIKKASTDSGYFNWEVLLEIGKGYFKTKSFQEDTYINIYEGVEKTILDEKLTQESLMKILNAPKVLRGDKKEAKEKPEKLPIPKY